MYINQKEQYEQLGFTIENALIKSVSISMADLLPG